MMKRDKEIIVILLAVAGILIAICAWLLPFSPLPFSPLDSLADLFKKDATPTVSQSQVSIGQPGTGVPSIAGPVSTPPLEQPAPSSPPQAQELLPNTAEAPAQPNPQAAYSRGNPPIPAPLGWAVEQNGVQLNLVAYEIRTGEDYETAAAGLKFLLLNKSGQRLLVEFDRSLVSMQDSAGTNYVDYNGPGIETFWIDAGQSKFVERYYALVPDRQSRIPPSALPVTVLVQKLSRVENASWILGGNPIPTYKDGDIAGQIGKALRINDFDITLTALEVRATSDYESAAIKAEYNVKNNTNQRKLLDLDFAYIYAEDNYGTRYIDYEGGGLFSKWIDPGDEFTFERYYSIEYNKPYRVPIGASYVVVVCEGIGNGSRIQWRFDIIR